MFREGLARLEDNLSARYYTSVVDFSKDFAAELKATLATAASLDTLDTNTQANGEVAVRDLPHDYKQKKILANRIVKAVKSLLEEAVRLESELCQKTFEKESRYLDRLLGSVLSRRDSTNGSQPADSEGEALRHKALTNGNGPKDYNDNGASEMEVDSISTQASRQLLSPEEPNQNAKDFASSKHKNKRQQQMPDTIPITNGINGDDHYVSIRGGLGSRQAGMTVQLPEPSTPPMSSGGDSQPFSQGGIPWYMEPFDPSGTTIQEERWTGRELVRGMSEDLSDMDEEELSGLVDVDDMDGGPDAAIDISEQQAAEAAEKKRKAAKRRRWRGFR